MVDFEAAIDQVVAGIEFWMGIAGPIASALIGGVCLGLAWVSGWPLWMEPATPLLAMLVWLGYINLALEMIGQDDVNQLPVLANGQPRGMISRSSKVADPVLRTKFIL